MSVRSLPKKIRKCWLVTYFMLSPHMSTLFITSLMQTDGHKMAAVTDMLSLILKNRVTRRCPQITFFEA